MKNFKLVLALVLSIMMVLGSMSALAGSVPTNYSITINKNATDKAAHTYGAYQIFTGDLYESTLSNIQWGDNIASDTAITELKKISALSSIAAAAPAKDVAKAISDLNLSADSDTAKAIADAFNKAIIKAPVATATIAANATTGTISGLAAGYYLVKDTGAVSGEGAQTRFILEVVKDVEVTEKASVPTVVKKVKENSNSAWQDAADYNIGDNVPFQITGKTSSTAHDYIKYHVTFEDTSSVGLDAPESFKITVLGQEITLNNTKGATDNKTVDKIKVTATVTEAGKNFNIKVDFENTDNAAKTEGFVKLGSAVDSKDIVIEYTSKLNSSAVIGTPGNPNEVKLKYSNNPNLTDDKDTDEGETPKDKVVVFTFEIKALKVEPTSDAAIDQAAYDVLSAAEKADYVKIGDKWQKTTALTGAGFTLYKKVGTELTAFGPEVKTGSTFEFKGTDSGVYVLRETTTPAGYNTVSDIEITVTAIYDTEAVNPELKSLTVTPDTAGFTVTTTTKTDGTHIDTNGIISGKVLNQKGAVLPETGGVGTTIFYVAGSILVLAAAILLITKRRMGNND